MSPVLLKENSYGKIADQLGVHVSTINRELKRGGGYTHLNTDWTEDLYI